jgi:rfaE bifunctional protein nucleotidyltransferase chain/domain
MTAGRVIRDRGEIRQVLASMPRPVVFTNGCFDILHRGHVASLARAAALGNTLVVGVNSDESVRRLDKGGDRPFNTLEDRMAVLAALACVDLVVPFDEDTPADLIEVVRPDHLVKGGDWPLDRIIGADTVRRRGGEVHSIPFEYDRSTTSLIERIRRSTGGYKGS